MVGNSKPVVLHSYLLIYACSDKPLAPSFSSFLYNKLRPPTCTSKQYG